MIPKPFPILNPDQFLRALEHDQSVVLSATGHWKSVFFLTSFFHQIFKKNQYLCELVSSLDHIFSKKAFTDCTTGIFLTSFSNNDLTKKILKIVASQIKPRILDEKNQVLTLLQKRDSLPLLSNADYLSSISITKTIRNKTAFPLLHALAKIQRLQLMFFYAKIPQDVILGETIANDDVAFLSQKLLCWQKKQFPFVEYLQSPDTRAAILEKIRTCCAYKKCLSFCKKNPLLLEDLFHSVFKSFPHHCTGSVHLFVQMPRLLTQFHAIALDRRILEFNHTVTFIETGYHTDLTPIKDVKIQIHGQNQSISCLKNTVHLTESKEITVQDLFLEFSKQNSTFLTIEYLQSGIEQFDGRLSEPLLLRDDWWKQVPVVKRMTRTEISAAYKTSFSEGYAFLALRASRSTPILEAGNTHAWIDLALPLHDGTFSILSIGKYAERFPVTTGETFSHIFTTHRGTLTITDPNMFMSSRERTSLSFPPLTQETTTRLLAILQHDFLQSIRGQLIFQAQGNNCAFWVSSVLQRLFPNNPVDPFTTRIEDITLPFIFSPIVASRHIFPTTSSWNTFRIGFCCLFGALKTKTVQNEHGQTEQIRLYDFRLWKEGKLLIPSKLFLTKNSLQRSVLGDIK